MELTASDFRLQPEEQLMILTTGGLQGFMNAYGNLLRKVIIR